MYIQSFVHIYIYASSYEYVIYNLQNTCMLSDWCLLRMCNPFIQRGQDSVPSFFAWGTRTPWDLEVSLLSDTHI